MGFERVGHVVLKVRDLEVAKQFYGGVLGMEISSESPRAIFFRFANYHHDIGTFKVSDDAPAPEKDQVGLLHIALVVDSEETLKRLHKELPEKGVEVAATIDHGMTHSLYIYDPDGNQIEIYCEVPDYDWRTNNDFINDLKPLDLESAGSN